MKINRLRSGVSGDAVLLMMVKMVTIVLSFVITRLLSEYLSIYAYGTYSQALLVVSTVSSLTVLGMLDGVNYYYCSQKETENKETYMATLFTCQCIVGAVAGFVVLGMSGLLCAYFANPELKGLLLFCAVLPVLQNLLGMLQILLVSVGKAKLLAARNLVVSMVRLAVVLLVVSAVRDAAVTLLATLILDLLQIGFFLWTLKRNACRIRLKRVDFRLVKPIVAYCAPMAIFTVVNTLNRDLDKHLIAFLTDTETVAMYANASKQLPFDLITTSFCTVLLPKITGMIAHKNYREAKSTYKVFVEISYLATGILCGAAFSVAPQLMELLYSRKYMDGLDIFRIYILVDFVRFASITLILSAAGKTKLLMRLGLATLGTNAVLNVVFFRIWGTVGPAVATLITSVLMGIILLSLGARELEGTLKDFFFGKHLLSFMIASALGIAVFSAVGRWLAALGLWYVWVVLIVGGSYGICFLLLFGKRLITDMRLLNRREQ